MERTPGPWKFRIINVKMNHGLSTQEFEHIGPITGSGQIGVDSVFCSLPDARLIAAAPEMLSELEILIQVVESSSVKTKEIDAILSYSKLIVNKAKGE